MGTKVCYLFEILIREIEIFHSRLDKKNLFLLGSQKIALKSSFSILNVIKYRSRLITILTIILYSLFFPELFSFQKLYR